MAAQDYEQVTYNSPDGAQIGQSATEKVACYGATPVVQASAITLVATTASVSTAAISTSPFGFTSASQADAIVTGLNSVITALKNFGITA